MDLQCRWPVAVLILILGTTLEAHAQTKPYDVGHMGGSSMRGKLPFEGAFFSDGSVADQKMPSQAANRSVKLAFRSDLGWYAIAYYPKRPPKTFMKEYGRFAMASADSGNNSYVITLYDPDYRGEFKEVAPNPSKPSDLSGKKQVATVELKVHGNELVVMVKNADSTQVSLASGDTFRMMAGTGLGQGKKNTK